MATQLQPLAISREQAAEMLSVSLGTFERHIQPHLHTVRAGRRILVPVPALLAFLEEAHNK